MSINQNVSTIKINKGQLNLGNNLGKTFLIVTPTQKVFRPNGTPLVVNATTPSTMSTATTPMDTTTPIAMDAVVKTEVDTDDVYIEGGIKEEANWTNNMGNIFADPLSISGNHGNGSGLLFKQLSDTNSELQKSTDNCEENSSSLSPPTMKSDYKWSTRNTKMMLALYEQYKDDVGTQQIKNAKCLWERIAYELQLLHINVNASNCLNRWRVLERGFKKYLYSKHRSVRGRKFYEYEQEMTAILKNKIAKHPEYIFGTDSNSETQQDVQDNTPTTPTRETGSNNDEPQQSQSETDNTNTNYVEECVDEPYKLRVAKRHAVKRKMAAITTMEKLRLDRKEFYAKRLELEREKIKAMQRRNDLMEERNNIIKNLKCHCKLNM